MNSQFFIPENIIVNTFIHLQIIVFAKVFMTKCTLTRYAIKENNIIVRNLSHFKSLTNQIKWKQTL